MMRQALPLIFLMLIIRTHTIAQQINKSTATTQTAANKSASAKQTLLSIPFGKKSHIEYDTKTGTANIFSGSNAIITGAYAAVANHGKTITSKEYSTISYSKKAFKDAVGTGIKVTVELSEKGLPAMQQVFYLYPAREYFFTEVYLTGQSLSSNYMAPLIAGNANIFATGDNRILFVPFDNDTFISYNAKDMASKVTNTSAEVGAFYENESRKGLVMGSVEHTVWKTGIKTTGSKNTLSALEVWGGYSEAAVTRDSIPHGAIAGNKIKSPKIFIGYFSDWRTGLEAYAKANRKIEKPYVFNWNKPTPFGWNSWGAIQEHITYDKAVAVADFFKDSLPAFRNGNTAFIDLDSYWDNFVKGGMNGDLTQLKQFAAHCKSAGLEPGVYWAPFTDWGWNYEGSGSRKVDGGNYTYADIWTKTGGHYHNIDGARAIDPTHPGTKQRIALFISKLKECGFTMIKIDFLGHATVEADSFYDKKVTTGMQAYTQGMEYLVDQLGGQMLIYAAISPNLATGRYAHTRRIACDAFKTIGHTRYTLNSVNYGWWQTYVYNYIDADHIVFGSEREGANRARLSSGLITGTLFTGDDYASHGPWSARAKQLLQNKEVLAIAKNGVAFKPVDGNSGGETNDLFQQVIGGYLYLAVFNFTDKPKDYWVQRSRLGIATANSMDVTEIFSNNAFKLKGQLAISLGASDAAIYKIKL